MSPGTRASIVYPEGRRPRIQLDWVPGRGKPGLNADVLSATESVRAIADEDIEITGSNAVSGDTLHDISGAVRLLNGVGGATDSVILGGHEDANQSGWGVFTWGIDQETEFEVLLTMDSVDPIANTTTFAGLKLTNAAALATNNDQAFFRADDAIASGAWQAAFSVGQSTPIDTIYDTGIVASKGTMWHLRIAFDKDLVCRMYLNDTHVASNSWKGRGGVDLLPFVGVLEDTAGTVPRLFVHRMAISRALNL